MSVREFEPILKQVRRVLDDVDGVRWKDEVLIEYINEGQTEFCRETKTLRASAPLTTRANSEIYALPDDLYETLRIERNDGVAVIKSTSYDLAHRQRSLGTYITFNGETRYRDAVGIPTHYYQDLDGEKLLRFYPRPSEDILAKYQPFEDEVGVTAAVTDINDDPVDFDQETGVLTDSDAIFEVDQDRVTQDQSGNYQLDDVEDFTVFDFEEGVMSSILSTIAVVNVFYIRYPRADKLEIDDMRAMRYYVLSRVYEEDSPFQDIQKSEFYNDKFWSRVLVERGRVQTGYGANIRVRGEYF